MRNNFFKETIKPLLTGPTVNLINYFFIHGILKQNITCTTCFIPMLLKPYKHNKDGCAFRYLNKSCTRYTNYINISFFAIHILKYLNYYK